MIFKRVFDDENLFQIRREQIADGKISVNICNQLQKDGIADPERVLILKLDDYCAYNSKHTPNPPQVIDNLVVVKCCDGSIAIYLLELRSSNGRRPIRRLTPTEIEGKFKTAANDFLGKRFSDCFKDLKINQVKANLVSDPWQLSGQPDGNDLFSKKMKLSALDAYASRRPIDVLGVPVLINPVLPPNPVIGDC